MKAVKGISKDIQIDPGFNSGERGYSWFYLTV